MNRHLRRVRTLAARIGGRTARRRVRRLVADPRTPVRLRRAITDPAARRTALRRLRVELNGPPLPRRAPRRVAAQAPSRLPELPAATVPTGPVSRPGIRVAVILDPFSELALRYEWDQVTPTPLGWREELSAAPPRLLFVESAWRGNRGAWRLSMTRETGPSAELCELVQWCREQGIPSVFWNKEDPPNYDRFLQTARLFDHVLTVDADRIPDYVRDLGHDRVGLLPFGAQPRIHSPVRRGPARSYPVAFAGTYFREKHPERREQMDVLLPAAQRYGLHIYSRMEGEDARYRFPSRYEPEIVGSLPYEQMLAASTAYQVFLNVNSVTRSPSMCARRLFELSAAQTPVLSGAAASIANFFGDTVAVATTPAEADLRLGVLMAHPEIRDRQALRAHRLVFDRHLYRHRVDQVLQLAGVDTVPWGTSISVVVPTRRPGQVDHVLRVMAAQVHPDMELILVPHGFALDPQEMSARAAELGLAHVVVRPAEACLTLGACMNLGVSAAGGRYVAKVDDDNYYAPHYLSDLVRAFAYSDADVVGKWAHYVHLASSGATLLRFEKAEHRYTDLVQGGTLLMPRDLAVRLPFEDLLRRVDTTFLEKVRRAGGRVYSADRFNFVSMRSASPEQHTWGIQDDEILTRSSRLLFYGDARDHATV